MYRMDDWESGPERLLPENPEWLDLLEDSWSSVSANESRSTHGFRSTQPERVTDQDGVRASSSDGRLAEDVSEHGTGIHVTEEHKARRSRHTFIRV